MVNQDHVQHAKTKRVGVYGAAGHTAKLVAAELLRRGIAPVLGGRDPARLAAASRALQDAEVRVAHVDRPDEMRAFLNGCDAVVNCAGPFEATAMPIASLAIAQGISYFDFTTDASVINRLHDELGGAAAARQLVLAPATGFYGTLADLMVRASAPDIETADEVFIAYSVKGWKPTVGSINAMIQFAGRRGVRKEGRFEITSGPPQFGAFRFPDPVGEVPVMLDYPAPEVVMIPRYLATPSVQVVMAASTVRELRDAPPPESVSDDERAGTDFIIVTEVRAAGGVRRATLRGRDIYLITAPIVAEAVERVLAGRVHAHGMVAAGEAFDAKDMLQALAGHGLTVSFN